MIVATLTALAEPPRLAMMGRVAEVRYVCELTRRIGGTQSRIVRNMQVLGRSGLVPYRRHAGWMRLGLNSGRPANIRTALSAALAEEMIA